MTTYCCFFSLVVSCFVQVIKFATEALASCEYQLNQFDAEAGDGDTGSVLKAAGMAIASALQTGNITASRPFSMLQNMSSVIDSCIGGTSAGLYSIFFTAAAKVTTQSAKDGKKAFLILMIFVEVMCVY